MNQPLTLQLHAPPPCCTWCNEVSDFVPVVTSKYGSVGGEVGTVGKALLRAGTPLVRTSYAVPVGMEMLRWGMISASQFKGSDLQIEMLVRVARLRMCQPEPACRKHIIVRCEGCGNSHPVHVPRVPESRTPTPQTRPTAAAATGGLIPLHPRPSRVALRICLRQLCVRQLCVQQLRCAYFTAQE